MIIRKAIIPVAGFGTRFLPATKAQPKEMLTIVDKPIIQYIVEEAVASGITDIIIVTSSTKRAVEDHFDRNFELEYRLEQKNKTEALKEVRSISDLATFTYVRQPSPLGDGHAILQAAHLIGDEPCAVLFGDDVVAGHVPCLKQMMALFRKYNDPVIAIEQVPKKDVSKYGIIKAQKIEQRVHQIAELVEKPTPEKAPSNLAIIGKYIITPDVLSALAQVKPGKDGEIRLIDALKIVVKKHPLYGYEFEGTRYDCGSKLGLLKATVDFGLQHAELKQEFKQFLTTKM
ncbi:MAG: UTP--glucose-1-phosphate uridylyltransferase [Candidatus Jacksonbacteria bacterium RIFCSPLOWO2_02_FULL_43_9]|nr:MAG: UTP--glucose-1-phosphate uridylyltransferase [Candidatus Jacksonbacteria bacterium RIFCSPHIGHO2_02_FULL_43_10]OGY71265.1 MAG: UTP--glucose-1-phosphate uridylyltransferase [Candidatus Jacksonbacteria bacterium RIFCSPLOWO2_01_FULL_44_13]OGY73355.1 MAG: UTP--glucose-1-phosphate uridylyltransferase [Candidatus Jacksonbacteria bacterium RIFCSPLOWO2_02_FULL_43_9]